MYIHMLVNSSYNIMTYSRCELKGENLFLFPSQALFSFSLQNFKNWYLPHSVDVWLTPSNIPWLCLRYTIGDKKWKKFNSQTATSTASLFAALAARDVGSCGLGRRGLNHFASHALNTVFCPKILFHWLNSSNQSRKSINFSPIHFLHLYQPNKREKELV